MEWTSYDIEMLEDILNDMKAGLSEEELKQTLDTIEQLV